MDRARTSDKISTIASVLVLLVLTVGPFLTASGLNYNLSSNLANVDAILTGEFNGDQAGTSVANIGDVNGDGISDLLIGAPMYNNGSDTDVGKAYLIFGSKGMQKDTTLNNANASFIGTYPSFHAGFSVAGAGDVNGDGYKDFLIGMPGSTIKDLSPGKVFLFFGHGGAWQKNVSVLKANVTFSGEKDDDKAGTSVAGVGDVTGDGFDDILIGAPNNGASATNGGQAYLVYGRASNWPVDKGVFNLANSNASFQGDAAQNFLGTHVAAAGDVNNDHLDDFLIAAPNAETGVKVGGKVYLFYGRTDGWSFNASLEKADVLIKGMKNDNSQTGTCIAGVGDVDGNNYDDIVVCSKEADHQLTKIFGAYLFLSGPTGIKNPIGPDSANVSYYENTIWNMNGLTTASPTGDVNGDGFSDFLLGDRSYWTDKGRAFLITGNGLIGETTPTVDVLTNAAAAFVGETDYDNAAAAMDGGGDINADGYSDSIVGAPLNDADGHGVDPGRTYLIYPDHNKGPGNIVNTLTLCKDKNCNSVMDHASRNDTVYIRLAGGSGNVSRKDVAMVKVHTSKGNTVGYRLPLIETGVATGIYLGSIKLANRNHEDYGWIKAVGNETFVAMSVNNTNLMASLFVLGDLKLRPYTDDNGVFEDQAYSSQYWGEGCPTKDMDWSFKTNATWLRWNITKHNLTGTPTNKDVGSYWVNVTLQNKYGQKDLHNFTLKVKNVPPVILGKIIKTAKEHKLYINNLTSTDDGQGKITWHLATNSSWLKVNASSGQLYGTPEEPDVGNWSVNASVDDGNGGWAWMKGAITVQNVNDPPVLNTIALTPATEGVPYLFQCNATDPDKGDLITWSMVTNTTGWLTLLPFQGMLQGTPHEADVGVWEVDLTVTDLGLLYAQGNFTLTVLNVNEPPVIVSTPETKAIAGVDYRYDVKVFDPDTGETMTYNLPVHPDGMVIDGHSGTITWNPSNGQAGENTVSVKVFDGGLSGYQNFTVRVEVPTTNVSLVTLKTPLNGSTVDVTNPQLQWSAASAGSGGLYFDVFLGEDPARVRSGDISVREAHNIIQSSFFPWTPLDMGKTYYWTVVPNDGVNTGICLNGVWSFTVKKEAVSSNVPTAALTKPANGTILTSFPVQLTWSGADPHNLPLLYNVYLSQDRSLVMGQSQTALVGKDINVTDFMADGILTDTIYYWTVIPANALVKGQCLSGIWSFKVSVNAAVNHPPVITSRPVTTVYSGDTYQYKVNASDQDKGDTLSYSLSVRPVGMVIDQGLGIIMWMVADNDVGDHTVVVRVSDGHVFVEQTYTLKALPKSSKNHPPRFVSSPKLGATVGEAYSYTLDARDNDTGDSLEYYLVKAPAGMTISKDGRITWTPKDEGKQSVKVAVSDGKATEYQEFVVNVKAKPSILSGTTGILLLIILILVVCIITALVAIMVIRSRARRKAQMQAAALPETRGASTQGEVASGAVASETAGAVTPAGVPKDEGVEDFSISEIFLIYNDGRLIAHTTTEKKVGIDKQIVSGMLVAIQSFVKESFQTQQGLNSFEFGSKKVVLMGGKYVILAAVLDGIEPHMLRDEMQGIITRIETLYAGRVELWDGNTETFNEAIPQMSSLFRLRARMKIREKVKGVRMKSGVEFYSGYVRLKVGVSNEFDGPIGNIVLDLAFDMNTLRMSRIEPQYPMSDNTIYLPDIQPGEKRTVAVYFDPLICQESHIDGKVRFTDTSGNYGEAEMKRRPVDIVCPIFYTVETINVAMLKRLLGELTFSDSRIYEVKERDALPEAHALAVTSVKGHDVKLVREFTEDEPYQVETWFYGEAKESEEKLVIKVSARSSGSLLEIFVASDNLASMTGLLAELGAEFRRKLDDKGIDRESLLLSTDERMRDVLKETALLLDKYAESEAKPEDMEQR
jgi:hypothetical protein